VKGKVSVKGSNASVQHTINEDERTEFTRHINSVSGRSYKVTVFHKHGSPHTPAFTTLSESIR
jgi:uncharacterized protein YxeA